jgi:pimeloyl-ACP methyl ester carboxylesterase
VLVVVALAAGACGPSATAGRPSSPPVTSATPTTAQRPHGADALRWSACRGSEGPAGYQCATLQVPLDYADPSKGIIGIALDRHQATGRSIGDLLVNPGGPGVSGVNYLPTMVSQLSTQMRAHLDVVGFDPRGVDRSDPIICGTGRQLDAELTVNPSPTTVAGFDAIVASDRRFIAGCQARSGALLPYVATVDAARDIDRIRIALGRAKLDYLGFSYGTYLGAVYAKMFPSHIRAMVLDGAIDPDLGTVATVEAQAAALDHELDAFLAACLRHTCDWSPNAKPAAAFAALITQVTKHPMAVSGSDQQVNTATLLYGAAAALYSPADWTILGAALTDLDHGQGGPILQLFDGYVERASNGSYSNVTEAETAVNCEDVTVPSLAGLRAAGPAVARIAPIFGLLDLYSEATCSIWPVKPTGPPEPIHAAGSPPIIVVGSTEDPITPYAWAQALAKQLDHGILLTRDGYGHTAYGFSSCIRANVDAYFLSLKLPAKGTTCPTD